MSKTKTVTIDGFIVHDYFRARWPKDYPHGPFVFQVYKPMKDSKDVLVQEHSITVEVPADFDPRPGMVEALEAQKAKARAEFAALVVSLDRQINELLAIECAEVA